MRREAVGARLGACALLVCCVVACAAVHADARVLRRNVAQHAHIADIPSEGIRHCQDRELLPRGTDAVQLAIRPLEAVGPLVTVEAIAESGSILATGQAASGWTREPVTVPLRPRIARTQEVTLCMATPPGIGVGFYGRNAGESRRVPGEPTIPTVQATYLESGADRAASPTDWVAALAGALLALLLP